jgi:predicted HNH restriction endonuclease
MANLKDDDIAFDDMEFDTNDFDDGEFDINEGEDEIIDGSDEIIMDEPIEESSGDSLDVMASFHDEAVDESDLDGAIVDGVDLHEDEDEQIDNEMDFISDAGNIVVQDANDDGEKGFGLQYINIEKIAITQRIRKMQSVEGLVQSIQSTGLLCPIVVAPTATEGLYVLLEGYRRLQACARVGLTKVPCVVNNRVSTPEIPILEAMYNHSQKYSIKEQVDYINYLETQKGIMNPAMIEYLLQMNSGDYTKLKDILADNDDDIVEKLYDGAYDIGTAFRKLEQRRKKETLEEKENKKAARVYDDEEASGADQIEGSGEDADSDALTEDQINALAINAEDLDDDIEETSLNEMVEEDKNLEGFKPHKQKVGEREYVDPIIKKTVMARDKSTCQCCKRGGEQYVDILDYHHILPVFLSGADTPENGIMLCVSCHRLVHLYSTDDLHIDTALLTGSYDDLTDEQKSHYENEEIFEDEKRRFKRIIKLGSVIRKGIVAKGMNKDQYKKEHSNNGIGRRKPGVNAEQETL